jgi:hypothetical protein
VGWWKIEGTEITVGDAPLDALGEAVSEVIASYRSAFGRLPTCAEWESLLAAALRTDEPNRAIEGRVTEVRLQTVRPERG